MTAAQGSQAGSADRKKGRRQVLVKTHDRTLKLEQNSSLLIALPAAHILCLASIYHHGAIFLV